MRRRIGCGWLPPSEDAMPWKHTGDDWGTDENGYPLGPSVCPSFTTELPDVIDIAHARAHWEKGQLREYVGDEPSRALMDGITVLHGAVNACESHNVKRAQKGGENGPR